MYLARRAASLKDVLSVVEYTMKNRSANAAHSSIFSLEFCKVWKRERARDYLVKVKGREGRD